MNVGILGIFQNDQGRSSDAEMMRAEMGGSVRTTPDGRSGDGGWLRHGEAPPG